MTAEDKVLNIEEVLNIKREVIDNEKAWVALEAWWPKLDGTGGG
jgi:hypothetical protein